MSSRRATGAPAAFARDGKAVPPSADVAERTLAEVIGETVAIHVAKLLGPVLAQFGQAQHQPGCVICVQERKAAEHAHGLAVANAVQAAEEPPAEAQLPGIMPAITWMPLGQQGHILPVCYGHIEHGPQVRATGPVTPSGQPIIARS